jgi:hypothetical protein
VGRASNRKKARRQAERNPRRAGQQGFRRAGQGFRADAGEQYAMLQLANGLEKLIGQTEERREQRAAASRAWRGGEEPVPAEAPEWPEDSLGDRFFGGTFLARARDAPCLLNADVPDAAVIAADPAQQNIAVSALIRAVAFDGLRAGHPAVSALLGALAPIAGEELARRAAIEARLSQGWPEWEDDEPEVAGLDGPVFLLGGCVLTDATWAVVGEDPLSEVLGVLAPALDGAVPGVAGRDVADALIAAFATHYRCELPGDAEVLQRVRALHGGDTGDALMNLAAAGTVPPADVFRAGLAVLAVLADLCRSGSASILQRAAPTE